MQRYFFPFYIIVSILLLSNFVMLFYDFQFRGYWTEKIISWIWLLSTFILIIKYWKNKWAKFYTGILTTLMILSLIPFGLPLIAYICFNTTMCNEQRFIINPQYRLEISTRGLMSRTHVEIYQVRNIIFEKKVIKDFAYRPVVEALFPLENEEAEREQYFYPPHFDDVKIISQNTHGLNIQYTINGRSKVIFHTFEPQSAD